MDTRITINGHNFERAEFDEQGKLHSRRYYEMRYLPTVMQQLAVLSEPEKPEHLLKELRKMYRLFNARTFEFKGRI